MKSRINKCISNSVENYQRVLNDEILQENIENIVIKSVEAFRNDKKMLFCGNGGSASDAQHIAAELSGRFYSDRSPLYAEALHVNSSYMTAIANDYGYDRLRARFSDNVCELPAPKKIIQDEEKKVTPIKREPISQSYSQSEGSLESLPVIRSAVKRVAPKMNQRSFRDNFICSFVTKYQNLYSEYF